MNKKLLFPLALVPLAATSLQAQKAIPGDIISCPTADTMPVA